MKNMNSTDKVVLGGFIAFFACLAIVIPVGVVGAAYGGQREVEKITACVENGGSWIQSQPNDEYRPEFECQLP